MKTHRSTRRRSDLEQVRLLQAGLTLQTINTILDREVSMIKPAIKAPEPRQPSQQAQQHKVTATVDTPQPTVTRPTPLHPPNETR